MIKYVRIIRSRSFDNKMIDSQEISLKLVKHKQVALISTTGPSLYDPFIWD